MLHLTLAMFTVDSQGSPDISFLRGNWFWLSLLGDKKALSEHKTKIDKLKTQPLGFYSLQNSKNNETYKISKQSTKHKHPKNLVFLYDRKIR